MSEAPEALILDLLEWLTKGERSYEEAMEAWRTSSPKLPVWEDANDHGYVAAEWLNGKKLIRITAVGRAFLERRRSGASAR